MLKRIFILRRLLLCAGLFSGLLIFWLPAHEVFEGPKTFGFLIYSALLLAVSLPLLPQAVSRPALRPWLLVGGALLGASLLSLLSGWRLLPNDTLMSLEKLAPMVAGVLAALVYALETKPTQKRVIFSLVTSLALMAFYGLVQFLDQTLGQSLHVSIDLIRWTSFGESRIYSTLGNPDYMAAHLTVFLPLWLALPWRDKSFRLRGALSAASIALGILPLLVLLMAYGTDLTLWTAVLKTYPLWALCAVALYLLCRKLSMKSLWLGFAYLLAFLVIVAQGRAAYLGLGVSAAVTLAIALRLKGLAFFRSHSIFFRRNALAAGTVVLLLVAAMGLRRVSPDNALLEVGPIRSALAVSDSLVHRLGDFFGKGSDATNVRRFYYEAAIRLGMEHPLLGIGFGNHALFTAGAQSEIWKGWESSGNTSVMYVEPHVELYTHNDFLQNFAETGLVGLAAFLFFWSFVIFKGWKLSKRGWGDSTGRLGIGLLGLTAAFVTSAMLNFPWRVLATQQLCWLAFAMLAVADAGLSESQIPASPSEALKTASPHPMLLAGGLALAFILALWPARWFFATCLFKQGNLGRDSARYQVGADFYQKAVDVGLSGSQRVELYLYLGSMENMIGRPDLAEMWFKEGVKIYPDFIEALYNLGYTSMIRFNTSHLASDRQNAIDYFNQVLAIDPRYSGALNNVGNLYYSEKDFSNAAKNYETLVRFSPDMLEARYNLAVTDLVMQKRQEGEQQLQEALRIKPGYPQALSLIQQLKKMPAGAKLIFQ